MLRWSITIAVLVVCAGLAVSHDDHLHHHEEAVKEEEPHWKYSRAANEEAAAESHHHHEEAVKKVPLKNYNPEANEKAAAEEHHHDHSSDHKHVHDDRIEFFEMLEKYQFKGCLSFLNKTRIRRMLLAVTSTVLISLLPCIFLSLIPVQANKAKSDPLLKVMLAFGAGGLLGDAFLHLIPHSTHGHEDSKHAEHSHDNTVGLWVIAGIVVFLVIEKLMRSGHSHHHHQQEEKKDGDMKKPASKRPHKDKKKQERKEQTPIRVGEKSAVAFLNVAADFIHNITDGLAIGTAYTINTTLGVVTTIAVLVHEVPHEIGDFAILVQSGYSKKKAMLVQLYTALGAVGGCAIALWVADPVTVAGVTSTIWILPFTAGGFIYIATVSVIPELLEKSGSLGQSLLQIVALVSGVLAMHLIALYE